MRIVLIFLISISCSVAQAQQISYVRQLIDTLCLPKFDGRGYVNNGDSKAAAFIAKEAALIGLQPLEGNSFFQDYSFAVNCFPGSMSVNINGVNLDPGRDYIINPNSTGVKGEFNVLYFKPDWIENKKKLTALSQDKNLAKTVLVFNPNDKNEAYQKFLKNLPEYHLNAAAYLILTNNKLTWSVGRQEFDCAIIEVSAASVKTRIKKVRLNIENHFNREHYASNVLAYIPGKTDSTIVFTAHYDHLGRMGKNTYMPGANDNASGTALLFDLAKYYLKNPNHYSIQFMWFSGEEAGLLGSTYYVNHPIKPINQIKFLINLDLMADAKTGITVVNGKIFEEQFAMLSSINAELGLLGQVKARGKAANSDHYAFTENGVPSFFIYTTGDYKHYHDIDDTPENVPLTNYEKVFSLITAFAEELQPN